MRVGVLCSHRAPGLTHLLDRDVNRGRLYEIVCCLTSEESFAEQAAAADHGVPVIAHPIRRFCRAQGWRLSDPIGRAAYDTETVAHLAPYRVDLVVLASYLYVVSEPMLASFGRRIINIHHSDLTLRNGTGGPQLPGLRAVRDAILAGAHETRATVHLVTALLDEGPPFLRSWAFPVSPLARDAVRARAADVLKAYAYAHQEWMIRATWGPLMAGAIELIARQRLDLSALAETPDDELEVTWDLEESGGISRPSPVRTPGLARQVAS
jgi:folate-dependent phosphoribosylglycinamide formyltransferase PurN